MIFKQSPPLAAPYAAAKFTNISSNLRTAADYNHIFYFKVWVLAFVNRIERKLNEKIMGKKKSAQKHMVRFLISCQIHINHWIFSSPYKAVYRRYTTLRSILYTFFFLFQIGLHLPQKYRFSNPRMK